MAHLQLVPVVQAACAQALTHYYEKIQSMSGAGGRPKPKSFKRTMRVEADVGGAESHETATAAAEEVVSDNVPPP